MPYLTPDIQERDCLVSFLVPDDPPFIAAVVGAFTVLIYAYNWEQFGILTPDEAAAVMLAAYEDMPIWDGILLDSTGAPLWDITGDYLRE